MIEAETAFSMPRGTTAMGLGEIVSRRIAPTTDWTDTGRDEHFVQFYDADDVIVNAVAEYLLHGLKSAGTCIVAATGEHLQAIERIIGSFGGDLDAARLSGSYIPLDARETLGKFMIDGLPNAGLFNSVIGDIVKNAASKRGGIRVFGEMVGLLCFDGNYEGAIRLENLWNRLRKKYPFSLFCAYPMSSLTSANGRRMENICGHHSRVIPDESYTSLTSTNDRLRKIAILQQRSRQLEAELAELQGRISLRQSPVH